MKTYGLIGYPLSHSFSQSFFTKKFADELIDARYLLFPIEEIDDFNALLSTHPYIAGLNVTIPYKEKIIPFLDSLDESALEVGAVNVIKFIRSETGIHLKGYNSDTYGFMKSIKPHLTSHHERALIIGTGGASKAVAYVFRQLGIPYTYVSRMPSRLNEISYHDIDKEVMEMHKIVVNTTPLGMYPHPDNCPGLPYQFFGNQHLAYDLVYNPEETLFLKKAAQRGANIKNGIEMLFLQALRAYDIWTMEESS